MKQKIPAYFDIRLTRSYSEEEQYFDDSVIIRGDKMGLSVYCYKDENDRQYIDIKILGGRNDKIYSRRVILLCDGEIEYSDAVKAIEAI